mgnify:CR=1 FL=1
MKVTLKAMFRETVGRRELIEELERLKRRAEELGLPCYLVVDMGLTEVPPGTKTALGIGPDDARKIDKVTGNLPLVRGRWKLVGRSTTA